MNLTTYTYHETESANDRIEPSALQVQIQNSDIATAISGIIGSDGYYDIVFKDVLAPGDVVILQSVVAAHDGDPINFIDQVELAEAHDVGGRLMVVPEKRIGSDLEVATHNFADKTTWFGDSIRVENESPTYIDGNSYKLGHEFIIDMKHGKVHREDQISAKVSHGYKVVVRVDGYEQYELTPFEPCDNDCEFSVDYRDGYINFFEDQTGRVVEVDYSYATTSNLYLIPDPGKRIQIEMSEVQFSDDIDYTDAVDFEIWAYNPYDLPNKVPIKVNAYKSIHNFVDEAAGSYPIIPAVGGPVLGKSKNTLGFPFNYNTVRDLNSAQGIELRIKTRNSREFGGERSTATFYCTVHEL